MRIQTFNNGKGLIYGDDSKRIGCNIAGVLTIGKTEVSITPDEESILPVIANGSTGEHKATYKSDSGIVYDLGRVSIKGGRIIPPPQATIDLMELRCRVDVLEAGYEALREENRELRNIFDTDSLNFITK